MSYGGCNINLNSIFQCISYGYQRSLCVFSFGWRIIKVFILSCPLLEGNEHLSSLYLICICIFRVSGQLTFFLISFKNCDKHGLQWVLRGPIANFGCCEIYFGIFVICGYELVGLVLRYVKCKLNFTIWSISSIFCHICWCLYKWLIGYLLSLDVVGSLREIYVILWV